MEKFALLNLLKAIDGIQGVKTVENKPSSPPTQSPSATTQDPLPSAQTPPSPQDDMPNFMYETLIRHEIISNRLKNRKR